MPLCFIDIETRSRANLRNGIDRYFTEAELIMIQWGVDDGPVHVHEPLSDGLYIIPELDELRRDPSVTFVAHNAEFDMTGLNRLAAWNLPANRWLCTRVQAYAHGLPGGLDGLGNALGVPDEFEKIKDGKRLIQLFCVPRKDGSYVEPWAAPYDWRRFVEYGRRDTARLREIHRRLPFHNFTGVNLEYFWLNAQINERGFAVDLPLIESTVDFLDVVKRESDAEIAELTGGAVLAITQRDRLLQYLTEHMGLNIASLRKSELETALQADDTSPAQRLLIESRLEGSRASGAKYKRALAMHVGGRLRFTQQCSGAGRTGRTAHKGFQPGNMPRAITFNGLAKTLAEQHVPMKARFIDDVVLPMLRARKWDKNWNIIYGGPNTAAANALRHTIVAEEGNELTVADYRNIESRLLAWMARETWKLIAYAAVDRGEGRDLYKMQYSMFFGRDADTLGDHERQAGKVIDLACGFGGSVGAVVTMAVGYGMDLSILPALVLPNADAAMCSKAETAWGRAFLERKDYNLEPEVFMAVHVLVQAYRKANSAIDALKRQIGRAVRSAVEHPGSLHEVGRCKIWSNRDVMIVELPTGYRLNYWAPMIHLETVIDPEDGEEEDRVVLSFKRARGAQMIRERSWPGLTLENIIQAMGNQVLRHGKLEVEKIYPGTLTLAVHDEAIAEARIGKINLQTFGEALCKGWHWSRGLPLAYSGWQGPRYGKRD